MSRTRRESGRRSELGDVLVTGEKVLVAGGKIHAAQVQFSGN